MLFQFCETSAIDGRVLGGTSLGCLCGEQKKWGGGGTGAIALLRD